MAGDTQNNNWPLPKFRFTVDWGNLTDIVFQEVTGLETETQVIEYRTEQSSVPSRIKMPGIAKYGNVTLKNGVFVNGNAFWTWYSQIKMNTIVRADAVIKLLDETGKVTMMWTLKNAWPTKITSTDLKSDGNEVAVQSLEIAHEGLTIANPGS